MKELDKYFEAEKAVYEFFGFKEGWRVFPLDDRRDYYWQASDHSVHYSDETEDFTDEDREPQYADDIMYSRSASGIYRKDGYTMIAVDTGCDGNKFLAIFDNSKEVKDE